MEKAGFTREPPWRGCPAGRLSCGITSDGKIKGCLSLPDNIVEGDLRQRDLWNIWFDSDSFVYSRQFSENKLGANCRSCDKAELCHGGCSAMSYGVTGDFHNDPYCFYRIRKHAHMEEEHNCKYKSVEINQKQATQGIIL
jgi:radical SAM protein with 4Fe4S-binding SPASM domain